jgi:hypothetical protein
MYSNLSFIENIRSEVQIYSFSQIGEVEGIIVFNWLLKTYENNK